MGLCLCHCLIFNYYYGIFIFSLNKRFQICSVKRFILFVGHLYVESGKVSLETKIGGKY